MISRVWSSLPNFREAKFNSVGMNVVLANRGEDSEETESTNGLGKTTLLRILHFTLGAELSRDKVLSHPDLHGTTFGIDFYYDGSVISASRNTARPAKVRVSKSFVNGLTTEYDSDGDAVVLNTDGWRYVLAHRFIPDARVRGSEMAFSPTFRDLAVYFIRLGKDAFVDPEQAFKNQRAAAKRLAISYLLRLNWTKQRELYELVSERDRVSVALKALIEYTEISNEESIGELEAQRVVLERSLESRRKEIEGFNLRSDYHQLEDRLNRIDQTLHTLLNENHSDRRLLQYYEESAVGAPLFDTNRSIDVLKNAGAVFAESALRSVEEVSAFHAQVYQNRAAFLSGEMERLRAAIDERSRRIDAASSTKSLILRTLEASGALETLVELQRSTSEMSADLEALKAKIDERKRFDRRKDELTAHIGSVRSLLKQDLDERRALVDEAIELFAEYTRILYGKPGRLGVDIKDAGYKLSFAIDRQGSDGVDQMVVFCFDLVVATLQARRAGKFGTLIHDSSLFADVDPRQYGLALQLAFHTSAREGFQYICCLNAGALPTDHLGDLDLRQLIRLYLTDDGPEGRLLGIRLAPREA